MEGYMSKKMKIWTILVCIALILLVICLGYKLYEHQSRQDFALLALTTVPILALLIKALQVAIHTPIKSQ